MKIVFISLLFLVSNGISASDYDCAPETGSETASAIIRKVSEKEIPQIIFNIRSGKIQNGGTVKASATYNSDGINLDVKLEYDVSKRRFVPIPDKYLKDEKIIQIPKAFATEAGYLNLERVKEIDLPDATLRHTGRVELGELKNVHSFEIIAKNGKSVTTLFYHPSLPGLGWAKVIMVLNTIPRLPGYSVEADLENK